MKLYNVLLLFFFDLEPKFCERNYGRVVDGVTPLGHVFTAKLRGVGRQNSWKRNFHLPEF